MAESFVHDYKFCYVEVYLRDYVHFAVLLHSATGDSSEQTGDTEADFVLLRGKMYEISSRSRTT